MICMYSYILDKWGDFQKFKKKLCQTGPIEEKTKGRKFRGTVTLRFFILAKNLDF